ncbi:MAG: hypothetical protein QG552_3976 [Thermodesulfobacteriota bacterium]|nr:hypothetical protein [Thermodesulfobacteriota bacterium]
MWIKKFKRFSSEQILIGVLALVATSVLALFISLSFFNYPAADDFCFAAKARQLGFFGAQEFWYKHWSGRYTLNSVWTAIMLSGDIVHIYRFPPIVLLLLTWLGFSFLTARIVRDHLSLPLIFLVGGVWTLLFIAGTPDPAQTFYWLGGSITYQMPNIFLIFLIGLILWRETSAKNHLLRTGIFVLSSLLVIATIGSNEVSLLVTGMILSCGAFNAVMMKRDSRAFWIGLMVIAAASALISLLAPGNIERYAGIGGNDPLLRPASWIAALLYLPWVVLRILYWLSSLGLWVSTFMVLSATFPAARRVLYSDGKFERRFLILPLLWIVTIFGLNVLGFIINRYPLPERAESVVWLLFLLGWYPSFIILFHFLVDAKIEITHQRLLRPATILLIVSLLGTPNIFEACKDVYRGYRYHQEMRERFKSIQTAKDRGETDIIVSSVSKPPRTLFATEISTDASNHRNMCMRQFYEVNSIKLGDATR